MSLGIAFTTVAHLTRNMHISFDGQCMYDGTYTGAQVIPRRSRDME